MQYCYFVITPGVDIGSYIKYPDDSQGNYFKFGDTDQDTELGIRAGYTTHNPDIGIAGVLTNGMAHGNIGTRIKNDIIADGYSVIPGTEWFSVNYDQAWAVFHIVNGYDGQTIDDDNYEEFKDEILSALNDNTA